MPSARRNRLENEQAAVCCFDYTEGRADGNRLGRGWFPWPGLLHFAADGAESAPSVAPLAQPVITTHRVITYTYDSLYRLS